MMGFQNTGEASNPPKRTFRTSEHEFQIFLFLWAIFAFLEPDQDTVTQKNPDPIGIRIRNTDAK